ncbi:hypothetical protein ISE1_0501 [plant metagenome]|uniref:Uncharacterized protein n=1 Tax=plant metagenome TaxID=1297885 RepID=A0A484UMM3_9ZZZZ
MTPCLLLRGMCGDLMWARRGRIAEKRGEMAPLRHRGKSLVSFAGAALRGTPAWCAMPRRRACRHRLRHQFGAGMSTR